MVTSTVLIALLLPRVTLQAWVTVLTVFYVAMQYKLLCGADSFHHFALAKVEQAALVKVLKMGVKRV